MTENKKMEFWNKFREIPDKYKKDYIGNGGFRGTAYDHVYLLEALTNEYGKPSKDTWGYELVDQFITEGMNEKGQKLVTINVMVKVWIPGGETYGTESNQMYQVNKKGYVCDDEAFKKAVSGAIKKGFSFFGFGIELWQQKFGELEKPKPKMTDEQLESSFRAMQQQRTLEGLSKVAAGLKEYNLTEKQRAELTVEYETQTKRIKEKQ